MKKRDNGTSFLLLIPIVLFMTVSFLTVKLYSYSMPFSNISFFEYRDDTVLYDCFSYYKGRVIIFSTILAAVLLAVHLIAGIIEIKKTKVYIPLLVYALLVVLSYFLSDYKAFSLWGSMDRFEGLVILLCYVFMIFYSINVITSFKSFLLILYFAIFELVVASILGISQLLGCDILFLDSVKRVIFGEVDVASAYYDNLVYGSTHNPDYFAMCLVLVIPLVVGCILRRLMTKKELALLGGFLLILILLIINLLGANSLGAYISLALSSIVYLAVFGKSKLKIASVVALGTIIAIAFAFVLWPCKDYDTKDNVRRDRITYFRTGDNDIELEVHDDYLKIYADDNMDMHLLDSDGNLLTATEDEENEGLYYIDDARFFTYVKLEPVIYDNNLFVRLHFKEDNFAFRFTEEGVKYLNPFGYDESLDKIEHFGFDGNYNFASNRGYIYSTTLPILKKYILTGCGPDAYMFAIPQNDYAVKYSNYIDLATIFDKPHSAYLQMWVNTGLLSLISFMTFVFMILVQAVKVLKHKCESNKDNTDYFAIKGALFGLLAFLICMISNDSSVSTMPLFIALLGGLGGSVSNIE